MRSLSHSKAFQCSLPSTHINYSTQPARLSTWLCNCKCSYISYHVLYIKSSVENKYISCNTIFTQSCKPSFSHKSHTQISQLQMDTHPYRHTPTHTHVVPATTEYRVHISLYCGGGDARLGEAHWVMTSDSCAERQTCLGPGTSLSYEGAAANMLHKP